MAPYGKYNAETTAYIVNQHRVRPYNSAFAAGNYVYESKAYLYLGIYNAAGTVDSVVAVAVAAAVVIAVGVAVVFVLISVETSVEIPGVA